MPRPPPLIGSPAAQVPSQPLVAEVLTQPPVEQALFQAPGAGDGGLLGRDFFRWATPLGLLYGGLGLFLVSLKSRTQARGANSMASQKNGGRRSR